MRKRIGTIEISTLSKTNGRSNVSKWSEISKLSKTNEVSKKSKISKSKTNDIK